MALISTQTVTNLGETDIVVPATDVYNIMVTIQQPSAEAPAASQGAGGGAGTGTGGGPRVPSQVVTVIKVNSTTKLTSNAGDLGVGLSTQTATAGDTIKVILSSSLAVDNQPQAIKATIAVSQGPI